MAGLLFYLKMEKNIQMHQAVVPQQPIMKMELYAIYASMKDFSRFCRPGDEIEIHSDSGYCINIFTQMGQRLEEKRVEKRRRQTYSKSRNYQSNMEFNERY